jgi:hypothetical protein
VGVEKDTFAHKEKGSNGTISNDTDSGVVTIVFAAAADAIPVPTPIDLTERIPVPATGASPVVSFSAATYGGTVVWEESADGTTGWVPMTTGVFRGAVFYRANITLYAAPGYAFSGGNVEVTHQKVVSKSVTFTPGMNAEMIQGAFKFVAMVLAVVNDLNLTYKVPKPVSGGTPVLYFSAPQYTGAVVWEKGGAAHGGVFRLGESYTAAATLTAASGYTFDGMVGSFSHGGHDTTVTPNPETTDNGNGTVTVTVSFGPATDAIPVTDSIDLGLHIPAPGTGETAVRSFAGAGYTGTVEWKVLASEGDTVGTAMPGNLFQPGKTYRADVTLYAAPGYTLKDTSVTCTGAGTLNASDADNKGSSLTGLKVSFLATEKAMVNDLDLTYKVPKPVSGGSPVLYFSAPQYTGTVKWKTGSAEHQGVFQLGAVYTATVTLTAAPGWTFIDVKQDTFRHDGGEKVSNAKDSGVVTIVFGPVADAIPVPNIDLAAYIPAPAAGATPVTSFSAGTCGGTVTWAVTTGSAGHSGLFMAGVAYTAAVTLFPAPGYVFPDGFQATYNNTVLASFQATKDEASGRIAFPATGIPSYVSAPRFSGVSSAGQMDPTQPRNMDSAIDLIWAKGGKNFLYLMLNEDTESVDLGDGGQDIYGGLVLAAATTSPANVIIDGGRRTVQLTAGDSNLLITVGPGVTLTLRNITLKGTNANNAPLIRVNTKGTFILDTGAVLEGNTNSGNGGAVAVNGGAFTMSGGTIGGGIRAGDHPSTDKWVEGNGGGVYVGSGSFTMTGGARGEGTAIHDWGEALYAYGNGGGVYVDRGTFTMFGGIIGGRVGIEGTGVKGGGVYIGQTGSFNMSGGAAIRYIGNVANDSSASNSNLGGGVYVASGGSFTMSGGASISNNGSRQNQTKGGGVYVEGPVTGISAGRFVMNGGTISMNGEDTQGYASRAVIYGGGVYAGGEFVMSGGAISGNKAVSFSSSDVGQGGGVYVRSTGTFTMSGGTLSGNTAADRGGGVYVGGTGTSAGTFKKTGGIIYGDDDNVPGNRNATDNTAKGGYPGSGNAAYVELDGKYRNSTAGTGVPLDSDTVGPTGGWGP